MKNVPRWSLEVMFILLLLVVFITGIFISYQQGYQGGYKVGNYDAIQSMIQAVEKAVETPLPEIKVEIR